VDLRLFKVQILSYTENVDLVETKAEFERAITVL